ncbi:putative peptidyl-prolyl cis-trans isomerase Cbf2 precursor [Methyloligella halotolerans]|uniref:Parvulin-like PPIase n=1 Tax=Methyloligella halotolerans TaxID=1177755 RepID=A0A1E2RZ02_9HYPH|nr:peptidylprolyl isomerase [Methyloligella halotolerans]ODA67335.1 putative peptidyl-prolyl cis-trans isomerase Cbf2 precursor [Methyloligella halotolerans]
MKRPSIMLLAAAFITFYAFPAAAADDNVVARVNGHDITEQDLDFAAAEVGGQLSSFPENERRRMLVQFVIENELMATAAEAAKLDEADDFDERLDYHRRRALRDAYYDEKVEGAISEEVAKTIYEEQSKKMKEEKEIRARHILVPTKEEAEEVKKQLEDGADFAELAREKSRDPSAEDGDLGFFGKGQMVKPFETAVFQLKKGEISDPVETQFGWHIIEVTDERARQVPKFDDVKEAIMGKLLQSKVQSSLRELQSEAKIEIVDEDVKKAMQDAAMRGEVPPGAMGGEDAGAEDIEAEH